MIRRLAALLILVAAIFVGLLRRVPHWEEEPPWPEDEELGV